MAIRQDLVSSAITFLHDPSVANAPLEKKIAFLQSKNLTQQEIDASLAGSGNEGYSNAQPQNAQQQQQIMMRQPQQYPPNAQYPNAPYTGSFWQPPPQPEVPRRDWRDYFIMATVMSGLGYGIYFLTKRYIAPLVAPPTPPQLEQDKASVDASFERAFALIDQLTADTAAFKASEEARKEKLDSALEDVELAITELKSSSRRREDDSARIGEEVRNLQGLIPKAIKAQEEATDARLKELNAELKSLKTLIANRMTTGSAPGSAAPSAGPRVNGTGYATPENVDSSRVDGAIVNGASTGAGATPVSRGVSQNALGSSSSSSNSNSNTNTNTNSFNPINRYAASSKSGIPAWQMAASKNKADEPKSSATTESGTVSDAADTA